MCSHQSGGVPSMMRCQAASPSYTAAWQAKDIDGYYLFPGSRMRMLDEAGRGGDALGSQKKNAWGPLVARRF